MSLKSKFGIIIFIVVSLYISGQSIYLLIREKQKSAKLENNIRNGYETGFKIVDYYKAKNGQLVARNSVIEFSSKELKNGIAQEVIKQLDNLGIKPKFVTNYSETVIQHEKEIYTRLHDSVIFDTIKAKCFNHIDKYYQVNGCSVGDSQYIKINSIDSLIQVIYRGSRYNSKGKKRPGIFFWVPRRLEQVITSANPSSKITYSKTISISK